MAQNNKEELLRLVNLKTYYDVDHSFFKRNPVYVKAVDDVSFAVRKGETFGLVGESGCGKSTIGKTILRLEKATSGEIWYNGKDILKVSDNEMRELRKDMQMIFQDPYSSLNPKMTVGEIIEEPMLVHNMYDRAKRQERVRELLLQVGLREYHAQRYPHEFSGGQRQRIGIARALAVNPKLIICDEAVSALDVSIQAQVLNLLSKLQKEMDLTYIFIAHGMATVKHISDRVGVMYLGKMVELADSNELYRHPLHPYSQALISAIPEPDPELHKERIILSGDVPSPIEIRPDHWVACHLVNPPKDGAQ